MEILNKIVEFSQQWNGIREIPGNMGWENEEFEKMMVEVGWEESQAWCMWYAKMIWYQIFKDTVFESHIMECLTGSATQSYQNCEDSPRFKTSIVHPVDGAIVIWRKWNNGNPDWRGHAGLIIDPGLGGIGHNFSCIEGNTNNDGSRTGKEVAIKDRINNHGETDGLVVEGFIWPPLELNKLDAKKVFKV